MKKTMNFLKRHWKLFLILLLFLSWIFYSYFNEKIVFSIVNQDIDKIINFVNSFGAFAEIIFVLLVILEVVFAPIPPLILYFAAGILFGSFLGGILILFGNLIGAGIDFQIARNLGRKFIEKRIDYKKRKKFDKFSEKYGNLSIFLLRINPLTTSDLFSYLAGLSKMKIFPFLISTGLGLIPLIFIQTYFGDIFVKNSPFLILIFLIIGIIYLLLFFYLIYKGFLKQKNNF